MYIKWFPMNIVCILCFSLIGAVAAQEKLPTVTGGGGFPLSPRITSMWAAVDETAVEGKQPLTFMLYFKGEVGWHKRKWKSNQNLNSNPAVMEFSCDLTNLHAEFDRKTRAVSIFGKKFNVDSTNVILIEDVDKPKNEKIKGITYLKLEPGDRENPAAWVFQKSEKVQSLLRED